GQAGNWPNGKKINVFLTAQGQSERATALRAACGMSETDYTLYFLHAPVDAQAGDPPQTVASGTQVRQLVSGTANALGLIKASQIDSSVKVLSIDGAGPGQAAYKLRAK